MEFANDDLSVIYEVNYPCDMNHRLNVDWKKQMIANIE